MSERSPWSRVVPAVLALVGAWGGAPSTQHLAPSTRSAAPSAATREFLDKNCVTCHNSRLKTAGLELDSLDVDRVGDRAQQWEKVVTKLRTGEMPPPGRPRPAAASYRAIVAALEGELDAAAAAAPHPGRVPVHRLNRGEYTNAIRDLLGLE